MVWTHKCGLRIVGKYHKNICGKIKAIDGAVKRGGPLRATHIYEKRAGAVKKIL